MNPTGMRIGVFLSVVTVIAFLGACLAAPAHELSRIPSPTNDSDAIIVDWLTGALGSTGTGVMIVPHGKKLPSEARTKPRQVMSFIVGDALSNKNLSWRDKYTLLIKYKKGSEIYLYMPYWSREVRHTQSVQPIQIIAQPVP